MYWRSLHSHLVFTVSLIKDLNCSVSTHEKVKLCLTCFKWKFLCFTFVSYIFQWIYQPRNVWSKVFKSIGKNFPREDFFLWQHSTEFLWCSCNFLAWLTTVMSSTTGGLSPTASFSTLIFFCLTFSRLLPPLFPYDYFLVLLDEVI